MDGIVNLTQTRTILLVISDAEFQLGTMTLREWGERELYVTQYKTDPTLLVKALPAAASDQTREQVAEEVRRLKRQFRKATAQDIGRFDLSYRGVCWRLARALRRHHPDRATLGGADCLIEQAGKHRLGEIVRALDLSEERDLLAWVYVKGAGARAEPSSDRVPWAKLYRSLAERYGWTFEQIGELSMYAAQIANGAIVPEDGRFDVDSADVADWKSWQKSRTQLQDQLFW